MTLSHSMGNFAIFIHRFLLATVFVALLGACTSARQRAPVDDRSAGRAPSAGVAAARPLPGAENAGKPGYYTVKPGDTLVRVAVESGQNWRDIQRWNNLSNPNVLEVGQVLRVVRPSAEPGTAVAVAGVDPASVAVAAVGNSAGVETRPLDARPGAAPPSAAPATAASAPAAAAGDDEVIWAWPASGAVLAGFDEARSKGLVIAGQAGEAVLAAANGRVVYVGSELRGYGNLVIVKHNDTFLSAYAHNQTLLVKEGQAVRKGQKIAEMGASDASRVQLHFEVRRNGKPIDPARVLPAR